MNQLVKQFLEDRGLYDCTLEWITEGWGLPEDSITGPMMAAALFNAANNAEDPYGIIHLTDAGFGVLEMCGHIDPVRR